MKEYYIFIDESWDPNLVKIDNQYPIFWLWALIFEKEYFDTIVLEKMRKLKKENWFSEEIVFHSSEIRRFKNDFKELFNLKKREKFFTDINDFFTNLDFTIVSSVIKKNEFIKLYSNPWCPYDIAFEFILERVMHFLKNNWWKWEIFIENREWWHKALQKVFEKLKTFWNWYNESYLFTKHFPQKDLIFVPKSNHWVQLADLCIYPITQRILNRKRENQAFDCIKPKLYWWHSDNILKYWVKIYPFK